MNWQLRQMNEYLGLLVFRTGLFIEYAQVCPLPNRLSAGDPGHGPEDISINTIIHLAPIYFLYILSSIQKAFR